MVVAVCAGLVRDERDRRELAGVLGADLVPAAAAFAAGLLAGPHPLVAAGVGAWVRAARETTPDQAVAGGPAGRGPHRRHPRPGGNRPVVRRAHRGADRAVPRSAHPGCGGRAGTVGVHLTGARGGLLVGSVIAADQAVPARDVLAAAEQIVAADARQRGSVARLSLFDLPHGDGTAWSVGEEQADTTAPGGREVRPRARHHQVR